MNFVSAFNAFECGLWLLLALSILLFGRPAILNRRERIVLALALLLMSASEALELRTGAWWRPWWLAVWKGACITIMAWNGIRIWKRGKSKPSHNEIDHHPD